MTRWTNAHACLEIHNPDLQYKRDEWILNRIVRVISSNQRGLYSRETISLSLKASKRELYDGGLLTQFNNYLSVSHNFHAVDRNSIFIPKQKREDEIAGLNTG